MFEQLRFYTTCVAFVLAYGAYAQAPVADFTADITQGCSPLVVSFADLSTNNPTEWLWDLGNGNTSTKKNPAASYVNPGKYTIKLTAKNASGEDTETKNLYITVFDNPTVKINSSPGGGCAPLTVNFQDQSTSSSSTIVDWFWDFGDGKTSTSQNPSHTYTKSGTYNVQLIVTDGNGCKSNKTFQNAINVSDQFSASFTGSPLESCANTLTVSFTNPTSGGSGTLSYLWNFGDGTTSTQQNPSHVFNRALGTSFNVKLVVTDANGCADSMARNSYVNFINFNTDFSNNITKVCIPASVQFTDLSSPAADRWDWDFGDGSASAQQHPSHSYSAAGTYTVKLKSFRGNDCVDSLIKPGLITVRPSPVADFTVDSTKSCSVPFTVLFTDKSSNAVSWVWDFGDGGTSTLPSPTHTYTAFGYYTVKLTVTNVDTCSHTLTKFNLIQLIPPDANFSASPSSGCAPLNVQFTDQTFSVEPLSTWFWDFGDGTTSSSQHPSHGYPNPGSYTVKLTIVNSKGCADSTNKSVSVGIQPKADFLVAPVTACVNTPIQFTDLSVDAAGWYWQFGDGNFSSAQNPAYSYADTGFYNITLTVSNAGCSHTLVKDSLIHILPPDAEFNYTKDCGDPFHVEFVDQSAGVTAYSWDFGDGSPPSAAQSPVHDYPAKGTYVVVLAVHNSATGCVDTVRQVLTIGEKDVKFRADQFTGCPPLTVTFTDTSRDARAWRWDFGDGGMAFDSISTHTFTDTGTYDVRLIITNSAGCTDTLLKTQYIKLYGPTPKFGADTTFGCVPFTVGFIDSTFSPVPVISYLWNFGDGGTDTLREPVHTYTSPGSYTVSLTVIDQDSCSLTFTRTNYIHATYPFPSFSANRTTICGAQQINFFNSSVGAGLTYVWDFGDGATSSDVNPSHFYSKDGSYTIKLTALDTNGCDSTLTVTNFITLKSPQAGFFHSPVKPDCAPFPVTLTDTSLSPPTAISWLWDFGDGVTSDLQNPSHIYSIPGTYDVTLIITTAEGCRDTLLKDDLITVLGPYGTFTFAPDTGCIGTMVTFVAHAINTQTYSWDFGDGEVEKVTEDSLVHVYNRSGVFHPILILDDGKGCKYSLVAPDSIVIDTIPLADFSADNTYICKRGSVQFTDQTFTTRAISQRIWNFGDGETSTQQNPLHLYKLPGKYDVRLIVVNEFGCADTIVKPSFITIADHTDALFSMPDSTGCAPFEVVMNNGSNSTDTLAAYHWDFGDGTIETAASPQHTYLNAGSYTITLVATDDKGCKDTAERIVIVHPVPQAAFEVLNEQDGRCLEVDINLNDHAVGATAWLWNFGDDVSSTAQSPSHTYQSSGTYRVMQAVQNQFGCEDTVSQTICVFISATMFVPNAFSPNGDNINDKFVPLKYAIDTYNMKIFDRWGKMLFESNDPHYDWDGKHEGEECPVGVYIYLAKGRGVDGSAYKFVGTVALVR